MAQANAIVLRIRADAAEDFERLFERRSFLSGTNTAPQGSFSRRGSPYRVRTEEREVPGMAEHSEHDQDPRFNEFLKRPASFSPSLPSVFGGSIVFERG